MNPVAKLVAVMVSLFVATNLDATSPTVQRNALLLFAATVVGTVCLAAWIARGILAKGDQTPITVPPQKFSPAGTPPTIMTATAYDFSKLREHMLQKTAIPCVIVFLMFYYKGAVVPLVLHAVNTVLGLPTLELVRVHIRGEDAVGDLRRPWPEPDMMSMLTGQKPAAAAAAAPSKKDKKKK